MIEHDQYHIEQNEIVFSGHPSLEDRFWLEINDIGTVRDVVNSVRMTTVALGLETRKNELTTERLAVQDVLVDVSDPDADRKRRAADMGFMYGTLLTKQNQRDPEHASLPTGFIDRLTQVRGDLDLTQRDDVYQYFMRLRDVEVSFTGSDVLAFCLAATQDHVGDIFTAAEEESSIDDVERIVLQSNYYAGALAGALATTATSLPLPAIQIMRGQRDPVEQVSVQLEFEPGDNLEEAVEYQLRAKYSFRSVDVGGRNAVAIVPGGLQFAPNALSMPLYIHNLSETLTTCLVDSERIDAVLVEHRDPEQETTKLTVLSGEPMHDKLIKMQASSADDPAELGEIKGVVSGDICVCAYDVAHPSAVGIDTLLRSVLKLGPGEINYANELQLWVEHHVERPIKLYGRLAIASGVATIWASDVLHKIMIQEHDIRWGENTALTVGSVALLGGMKMLVGRTNRMRRRSAQQFDRLLQAYVDDVMPLQNPNSSGNIAD